MNDKELALKAKEISLLSDADLMVERARAQGVLIGVSTTALAMNQAAAKVPWYRPFSKVVYEEVSKSLYHAANALTVESLAIFEKEVDKRIKDRSPGVH